MEDCTFVIFGATGNLSQVKLHPGAVSSGCCRAFARRGLKIVGFGRRDWDDETWRGQVREWLAGNGDRTRRCWSVFASACSFFQGDLGEMQVYPGLARLICSAVRVFPPI